MKAVFVREKMAKHYIGEFGLFSMINRSIPGIVLCKILLTFVTEVSPELIDGFGADDSPIAPNDFECLSSSLLLNSGCKEKLFFIH